MPSSNGTDVGGDPGVSATTSTGATGTSGSTASTSVGGTTSASTTTTTGATGSGGIPGTTGGVEGTGGAGGAPSTATVDGTTGADAAGNTATTGNTVTTGVDAGGSTGTTTGVDAGGTAGTGGMAATSGEPIGFASLNGGTQGGEGGEIVTASSFAELVSYAESSTPYVIHVQGTISNGSGGGRVNVQSNKSIIGVGSDALLSGVGLNINNVNNIIVRNLRATLVGASTPSSVNGGDVISIAGTSKNIWIDHCELYSEDPASQTDIDKYDGLIDIKNQTGFITISYNHFRDHHKGGLVGAADDDLYDDRKITFHHNHYENVRLRIPMYRGSTGHFFNNYVVGATDATEIRAGTCVRVERNYYEPLHYSIYTPSDSPGSTELIENIEVDRESRAYPASCTADIPYSYSEVLISDAADVPSLVPQLAGVGKI